MISKLALNHWLFASDSSKREPKKGLAKPDPFFGINGLSKMNRRFIFASSWNVRLIQRLSLVGVCSLLPLSLIAAEPALRVSLLQGEAQIEREGKLYPAQNRQWLEQGDVLRLEHGQVQLVSSVGAAMALSGKSALNVVRYQWQDKQAMPEARYQLLYGRIRVVTGAMNKNPSARVVFTTPNGQYLPLGTSFTMATCTQAVPTQGADSGDYLLVQGGKVQASTTSGSLLVGTQQAAYTSSGSALPSLVPSTQPQVMTALNTQQASGYDWSATAAAPTTDNNSVLASDVQQALPGMPQTSSPNVPPVDAPALPPAQVGYFVAASKDGLSRGGQFSQQSERLVSYSDGSNAGSVSASGVTVLNTGVSAAAAAETYDMKLGRWSDQGLAYVFSVSAPNTLGNLTAPLIDGLVFRPSSSVQLSNGGSLDAGSQITLNLSSRTVSAQIQAKSLEGDVFANCHHRYDTVFFAVFWDHGNAVGNCLLAVTDIDQHAINVDFSFPASTPDAKQTLHCLGTSGSDKPGDAEYFPAFEAK